MVVENRGCESGHVDTTNMRILGISHSWHGEPIFQLTMLLAFAQTGKGYGDLNASKMMINS